MTYVGPLNMIVTEAVKKNASDVFAILDPDAGGAATFSVALSPSGAANATHWGTRTYLLQETYDALKNMSVTEFKAYVDQVSAERGREPFGSVTAFKNGVAMDEGDFWQFVTAQGLKPVAVDMMAQGGKN